MGRNDRPKAKAGASRIPDPAPPVDHDKSTPRFCLRHLQGDYSLQQLDRDHQAAFALALEKRAQMTWQQIKFADRHGLGSELIPVEQLRTTVPVKFRDEAKAMVLRYKDTLPMVGFRTTDTFHVVWIECTHGDVYDHG